MKSTILTTALLFLFFTNHIIAQAPYWQWVNGATIHPFAGNGAYDIPTGVCTDAAGNVYVTGYFSDSAVTFGTTTLVNSGFTNIFLVKYTPAGQVIWATGIGGTQGDQANAIACDAGGRIYIAGFLGSPSVTFGSTTLTNTGTGTGANNIFIARFDSSGHALWAQSAQGTIDDQAICLSADAFGHVYMGGSFASPSITLGSATFTNPGQQSIVVAKYDSSGTVLWAKSAGGEANIFDGATGISTDASGNAYVTGTFGDSVISFGGIHLICTDTNVYDNGNVFVTKYSPSGSVVWARSAGGSGYDVGAGISTDAAGNVYVTGNSQSPVITIGSLTLTDPDSGSNDIFIAKYDSDGQALWARNTLGSANSRVAGISTIASGTSYLAGYYIDTLSLRTLSLTRDDTNTVGYTNLFVAGYDASGNVLWAKGTQGYGNDEAMSIYANGPDAIYVAGSLSSASAAFGTDTVTNGGLPQGSTYIFAARLDTSSTTGILPIHSTVDAVRVYPNPSAGTFYFSGVTSACTIEVYDMLGQHIYTANATGDNYPVHLPSPAKGIYLYRISVVGTEIQQGKIVVE